MRQAGMDVPAIAAHSLSNMATTEEDLVQLEKDVRQVKIEYEIFFGGGRKRPPTDLEWRIDQTIKRYTERGPKLTAPQMFRLNGFIQRYMKFREVFRKRSKQREEGIVQRHFGAAAKEVELQRRRRAEEAKHVPSVAARVSIGAHTDPARESMKTRKLFEAFRETKEKAGENTSKLTLEDFREFVTRKSKELRGENGESSVEFVIATEEGRVKLKARVRQPDGVKEK
jgi:hypothetical protein